MQGRGLISLFTRERDLRRYHTGIFVTTATPEVVSNVAKQLHNRFPELALTFLTPEAFCSRLPTSGEIVTFETIKRSLLRGILGLRRRRFDLCIAIFSHDPYFRRSRFAALFFNARRVLVYNENCDSFELDRRHWKAFYEHVFGARKAWRSPSYLFIPFGLTYLLAHTAWLMTKARLMPYRPLELDTKDPRTASAP